ncbi:16S rRNA (guanine(527)-N(7))-methyltransferase RsmG [Palleronia sp. THAF1]|uniref:16S rRNA (guanine(527)-N(7))-methyltransferase RsmG n=1 Tax=Palleronia sp. THAF1 TaxID=2587842 RepID=UPI001C12CABB|nr:16S rRNA (guanine(527)-N(7))-methyltransferase RsmG [Palleronia sp. THAF1]
MKINLVAPSTLDDLKERHLADSAQLRTHAAHWNKWCDLGSGGGLPGIVISILSPECHVSLIESDKRKAVFLTHVVTKLDLNATVFDGRIETIDPQRADVVSARALAPLPRLIPLALRHGHSGTRYIFPKGLRWREEINEAKKVYRFDVDAQPSITDKHAVVLVLENFERA